MDEKPLPVHNGNDFSLVNAPSPFAFDMHSLSGLFFIFFMSFLDDYCSHTLTHLTTRLNKRSFLICWNNDTSAFRAG
ncbi:hypothetical protein B0G76_3150 [Paraburkholderia sp. BL23I1N1]|nr:hypothetical protein B0G76_3150 [Paraburkholderia sp. BL23I1N1]